MRLEGRKWQFRVHQFGHASWIGELLPKAGQPAGGGARKYGTTDSPCGRLRREFLQDREGAISARHLSFATCQSACIVLRQFVRRQLARLALQTLIMHVWRSRRSSPEDHRADMARCAAGAYFAFTAMSVDGGSGRARQDGVLLYTPI